MENNYDLHANDRAVEVGQRAVDGELVTHEYIFLSCHCVTLSKIDKLALLWGEAQKKIAYSYLKVI